MAKKPIRESEIKNRLRLEYFSDYDWTRAVGDIDLTVCSKVEIGSPVTYLWAETKKGLSDVYNSLVQLILTIGKARTYETEMPPYMLGAADSEKIALVEYSKVMHVFTKTDFNWNVAPSDYSTKEFKELSALLRDDLEKDVTIFKFAYDDKALRRFIRINFKEGRKDATKIPVTKNNFTFVYWDWVSSVKESVSVDWKAMEKNGILDCDFFLADLMSEDGITIRDHKVVLEKTKYKVLRKVESDGLFSFSEIPFRDGQKAYSRFWNRYERPPKPVYQKYILERRDLLVPQNIREVKGSYYTPQVWVRLAQEYLAKALGEDWQDEYYVWDCAAGSGNLLRGLTNKYNIYASTLDDSDVKVMHDAIDGGRLNLLKNNVFQFDFLNDGYGKAANGSVISILTECEKIPESLRKIIADPEKRKKLVIYINPPYLQSGNGKTSSGTGKNKAGATKGNVVRSICQKEIGPAADEMFALFTWRISKEIPSSVLAEFSKLKILQAPNFSEFRKKVQIRLKSLFIIPGDTFDNVKGEFPIGFHVWRTGQSLISENHEADVWTLKNKEIFNLGVKQIVNYDNLKLINDWGRSLRINSYGKVIIGYQVCHNNDFQNQKYINLYNSDQSKSHRMQIVIVASLLLPSVVYHAVRQIPAATWLNDRDQFLFPNDSWASDLEFQVDCLVWSIFNNAIREKNGICHWIPFYEDEVNAPASFNSRFMADFLHGKVKREAPAVTAPDLFSEPAAKAAAETAPLEAASSEALAVLDKGREIWRYYMSRPGARANASYLDIRTFFQGTHKDKRGKEIMNSFSEDDTYQRLLTEMRSLIKALAAHIEPKIYEHGFLLK